MWCCCWVSAVITVISITSFVSAFLGGGGSGGGSGSSSLDLKTVNI